MIALDTRCQQLLAVLLQTSEPMPANLLAKELRITPRMARYRLNRVELWLNFHDIKVVKRPGVGYFLDAEPDIKRSLLIQLDRTEPGVLVLSASDRKYLMLSTLLFSLEPLVVKQFQSHLNVSRTTVLKDFNEIDRWLEKYDLHLVRRQNFGCMIKGCESNLREAMIDCIVEGVGEANLLSVVGDKYIHRYSTNIDKFSIERSYRELLEKLNIDYFSRLVLLEVAGKLSLSDRALVRLILCLAVLTNRVINGRTIEESFSLIEAISEPHVNQLTEHFLSKIRRRFGVNFSPIEQTYLSSQLNKAAIRKSVTILLGENPQDPTSPELVSNEFSPNVIALAEELITYASVYLHPSLKVDAELLRNLAAHLTHLPFTSSTRMNIRNPLLSDIKREYSHIYMIAQSCMDIINRHLGYYVSDDELGYITMYLAAAMERLCISERKKKVLVICNAGRATAMLLVSRIKAEFPSIEIVGVMSYLEWKNRLDAIEYDLIVSTIPISSKYTPVIIASPLLAPTDVDNIHNLLEVEHKTRRMKEKIDRNDIIRLRDLIKPETIRLNVAADTWQESVEQAGAVLYKQKLIDHRYIEAMKDTIIKFGPYMVIWPGTVLLHARPEDGVRGLCMSLTTFRTPVYYGHEQNDPVDMALVLGAVDHCSHMPALYELNDIMQKTKIAKGLRTAANPLRVIKILSDHYVDKLTE